MGRTCGQSGQCLTRLTGVGVGGVAPVARALRLASTNRLPPDRGQQGPRGSERRGGGRTATDGSLTSLRSFENTPAPARGAGGAAWGQWAAGQGQGGTDRLVVGTAVSSAADEFWAGERMTVTGRMSPTSRVSTADGGGADTSGAVGAEVETAGWARLSDRYLGWQGP